MEAIDSDDYSSVGTSHRGGNADRDSRNKVGERDSKNIDYAKLMEESVDKLRMPITDGKIQLEGCRVLESLSESEESIQFFCEMGVIPVLIKAMRARGRDSRFQASACNTIRHIGSDGRIKDMVFQNNGVENIVKSMLNFPDHEDIQEGACFCLEHFIDHEEAINRMLRTSLSVYEQVFE